MSRSKRIVIASAAAGVAAVGAVVGVTNLASADPTATPTPGSTASPTGGPGGGPGHGPGERDPGRGHGPMDDQLAKSLATKLGIDESKVADALKSVRDAERPTTLPSRPDPAAHDAALAKALAAKLGIEEGKVKAALDAIRSERAADRTKTLDDKLGAAVKAGTLTQAEADAVKKAVDKGVISVGR